MRYLILTTLLFAFGSSALLANPELLRTPLSQYDYSIEVTRSGLNKLFVIFGKMIVKRQSMVDGPLEEINVTMAADKSVALNGIVKMKSLGRVRFSLNGNIVLAAPNRFDFLIDSMDLKDANNNLGKDISLKFAKTVMLQVLGIFVKSKKVTDYLEVETKGFVPVLGSIGTVFGMKRAFRFLLKPEAFPTKVLSGLDTVHASNTGERIIIQGYLKD